jgi:hypothetical protein
MRNALIPFVLLAATGCGLFSDGAGTKEGLKNDCIDKYEGWSEDVKDMEDEEDLFGLFNEIYEFSLDSDIENSAATAAVMKAVYEMDEGDREDYVEEYTDLLEDPSKDCSKAKEDFAEELADNEDACEAYFEWTDENTDAWEDFEKAVEKYQEDNEDAVSVPGGAPSITSPKDKRSKDDCKGD